MSAKKIKPVETPFPKHPFRLAVLRGLGVVLPPLLTIVIFLWVGNTVAVYLLEPLESGARNAWVWQWATILDESDMDTLTVDVGTRDGTDYRRVADDKFIPVRVYSIVQQNPDSEPRPTTAKGIYLRYVELEKLPRYRVVPFFLSIFILLLYFLGRFLAAGVGKFFWNIFERGIHQLPLVRNVYSSVKQVTDFLFSQRDVEYTHVVAIEYPRKGIWSLGLVTGESLLDIFDAAGEPVLSVLIPTSPMPVTGYTVTVKKSETVDLNLTVDQAFQFIVSCGVVVPPQQIREALEAANNPGSADATGTALSAPTGDSK